MSENSKYDVSKVIQLKSDPSETCKEGCSESITNLSVEERINHYLAHDYKLLYFGTETSKNREDELWLNTVVFMGK
jgi:hypothetical protein